MPTFWAATPGNTGLEGICNVIGIVHVPPHRLQHAKASRCTASHARIPTTGNLHALMRCAVPVAAHTAGH
jgi:hypothetical protein